MPELKQSHLDLLRDFENELENRAKFPDPKKSEKFTRIIEKLADPQLYKFMKDAVYSDSYTHSKAKNFLRKYFKKNYNKMLQAAQNQVKDLLEKYMKIVSSSSEEQKKQLIKSLKIMLDNITYGLSIDPKFPSDVKPLAEQIEAVSREIFELRT
ncbi:MAG: hypothetical protein K0S63_1109, partial [Gammaproteobacteria bacterium]|nr:hypothetical protein [Gammaproteobacteria bacterium]